MSEKKKPFQRLPKDVLPVNYKLELRPDLNAFVFYGKLDITAKVVKATKNVVLNCAEIDILSAQIAGGESAKVTYDKYAETVCLEFGSELSVGEVVISMSYTGCLNDQMRGFYRFKYTVKGEERFGAGTQFEATEARRALPCWDEPAHKATYDITLVVPKNRVALSNMNEASCEDAEDNLKRVTFSRTPVMSSYLLAFVIGEYDYVEQRDSNGVLVRVYTPVGKSSLGQFALDLAVKTLPLYTDFFGTPYPLPKVDLITIPDFAERAMENWGLITYREQRLLIDPAQSSVSAKQIVARTVGHELAHQWFGNLVTMEWWTHLWLNEGFANWMEYLSVDHAHPEYDIWTNFLMNEYITALKLDALANSHPIEVAVGAPSEVEEIFDTITYNKGCCIVKMLYSWIGAEKFKQGLSNYLKVLKYKNASTEDLWTHLAEVSGKPVATVMSTWTKQMGYPVLSVEGKQEGDKKVLTISQKKFCANGNINGFASILWQVPVTIATSTNPAVLTFVLDRASMTVSVEGVEPEEWILVNPKREGFYRVSYSTDLFSLLLPGLSDGSLSSQDRLGILNDAFAQAQAGDISTVDFLKLLPSYKNETCCTVWQSLVESLHVIDRLLSNTSTYKNFKKFAADLFTPTATRLGCDPKESESPLDALLRSIVIGQLGYYGDMNTIKEAQRKFADYVSGHSTLPADLKEPIFSVCLANGDSSIFDQLIKLHDSTDSSEERVRIYRCLGHGSSETLTTHCLNFSLSDKIRPADCPIVIGSATEAGPMARDMVWRFVKDKWAVLKQCFSGLYLLPNIIDVATAGFVSEEKAKDIEQFFKQNIWPAADRVIKQNCETIRLNAIWLNRDSEAIQQWLQVNCNC